MWIRANIESTFQKFILPENDNDAERTERLVSVVDSLKDKQKVAFLALLQKQKLFNENMYTFVEMCENNVCINCIGNLAKILINCRLIIPRPLNMIPPKPMNLWSI